VRRRVAVSPGDRRRLACRSGLFRDPSAVSKVWAMATAARADVEAKERVAREAKMKAEVEGSGWRGEGGQGCGGGGQATELGGEGQQRCIRRRTT